MGNHTITFHFSETQTTISGTTFYGLPGHDLNRTAGSGVNLVVHHVTETLVVCWSEKHLRTELTASVPVVHDLKSTRLVSVLSQQVGDRVDRYVSEWRSITLHAL